jgi:hypothetical protein
VRRVRCKRARMYPARPVISDGGLPWNELGSLVDELVEGVLLASHGREVVSGPYVSRSRCKPRSCIQLTPLVPDWPQMIG